MTGITWLSFELMLYMTNTSKLHAPISNFDRCSSASFRQIHKRNRLRQKSIQPNIREVTHARGKLMRRRAHFVPMGCIRPTSTD
jgi:hypothetical protein